MEIEYRHSYGIIPLFKEADGILVLLVRQTSRGESYWSFPKGTPEENESPIETARREVKEEVQITFNEIDEEVTFIEHYVYMRDEQQVDKQSTFFIGFSESKDFVIQANEIDEAVWCPVQWVEEKLTYPETKRLWKKVEEHLASL